MECNKEEAIRAKGIAEKRMENKDFVGARKIAIKAQRLYPDLENISQMICVCDVHCSAESKNVGSDKDWYDILSVEKSADEVSIKKQYRKLALLLHPDKNKFAGAEAAFMLIGEAQKVLLDKEKRHFFDARYARFSQSTAPNPPQPTKNPNNVRSPSGQTNAKPPSGQKNAKPPSGQSNARTPSGQNNTSKSASSHVSKQPQQQAQPGVSSEPATFWTVCPFCAVKYRYHMHALNLNLLCQNCKKHFIAYDMRAESTTAQPNPQGNANRTASSAPAGAPNQAVGSNGRSQGNPGQQRSGSNANQTAASARGVSNHGGNSSASNGRFQGNSGQAKQGVDSFAKTGQSDQFNRSKKTNELNMGANKINRTTSGGSNAGKSKKKQAVESNASVQPRGSTASKDTAAKKGGDAVAGSGSRDDSSSQQLPSQSKRPVSDNGVGSVDETVSSSKRFKVNPQASSPTKQTSLKVDTSAKEMPAEKDCVKDNNLQRSCKVDKSANGIDNSAKGIDKSAKDKPEENDCVEENRIVEDVPDSDFNDFDQIREANNFKAGQIWAIYDTLDAMPRFYAQIRKVFSPGFKLRISWLEPDPDEKGVLDWVDKELPFSSGNFKIGDSENTEDRLMFSHLISWEKGPGRGSIMIRPKKDEIWALYRDWHMDWRFDPDNHKEYEYEFVEVLSDYDARAGVRVAFLGKLKGFSCLFCQKGGDEIQIPPSEYLRFSHNVPSYRMTGEEREGVPRGSFELDPASIPPKLEEMSLPKETNLGMATDHSSVSDIKLKGGDPDVVVKENESEHQNEQMIIDDKNQSSSDVVEQAATEASTLEAFELPDPEFFNFDVIRKLDMFQVGQVWALYSDTDGLPKYYGQIKKVELDSEKVKLKIAWLEAFSTSDFDRWRNRKMPICCGKFKIKNRKLQGYCDSTPFSHQLRAGTVKANVFEIYPREGEIWAMYKNWNLDMTPSDLENCEYDFVEILEESIQGSNTRVLALEQVPGHSSVFKAKMSGDSLSTMEIPHSELLRFSHQIPSHDLTEEKGGSLRGFKELDPAGFPASFFSPKLR